MQAEKLLLDNSLFLEECLKLLSEGESVTLRASGDSMFPFIANGATRWCYTGSDGLRQGISYWFGCTRKVIYCIVSIR